MAREQGYQVHALSVAYGQRHNSELAASERVARCSARSSTRPSSIDLRSIGGSALTADIDVPLDAGRQQTTSRSPTCRRATPSCCRSRWAGPRCWAPATSGAASTRSTIPAIPDCRPAFIEAFESLANVATKAGVEGAGIRIHAPLMRMSKADIAREGQRLGVDFSATVSCYQADDEGRACGHCDACRLRAQGFREAGLADPTRYV